MNNKRLLLALNRIKKMGPRTILKLQQHFSGLEGIFRSPIAKLEGLGLPEDVAHAVATFDFRKIEVDLKWEQQQNHALLTWNDLQYPALLKEIHDPPPVLYAVGDLSALEQPMIAIVGSRNPTVTGCETSKSFAFELASQGISVVSGLALGIDAQAHLGSLKANGKTIAVMATGVDRIYPYRHKELSAEIRQTGLLLSEFPLGTLPIAGHFPRRNRIISGLSLATLVVEAAIRSGSLITARFALEQNRDVLAIPGSILNPQSRGCHYLLQQGARLVTSAKDVLLEVGINEPVVQSKSELKPLANENKNLVKCIGFEVTTVDQMIERSGLSIETIACDLAELEIQGIVTAVPGGYMRCTG